MIPKIIHYCWFGRKPLPELAQKCIESWKKYLPEYEIKKWNEDNFDVNIVPYTAEAYKSGKFAFVSDYARFWILYNYGGLYFDTDVEVIKPMDEIVEKGPFMGCELSPKGNNLYPSVAPGLGLGVNPGLGLYKKVLEGYNSRHLYSLGGVIGHTVVQILTKMFIESHPYVDFSKIVEIEGIKIYPWDYFCPLIASSGELKITENTYSIHHYTATWAKDGELPRWRRAILRLRNMAIRQYGQFIWPILYSRPKLQ